MEIFMTQRQTFLRAHTQFMKLLDSLSATDLDDHQKKLIESGKAIVKDMDRFLSEDYIDFEEIGDSLPSTVYLYVADKYGKTIYISELYSQMSGISRNEIIGRNVFQINKEKKLYSNGVLPYVLRQRKPVETIGVMQRTNIKVHLTGIPLFDSKGELRYGLAFGSARSQSRSSSDSCSRVQRTTAAAFGLKSFRFSFSHPT